MHGIA